jgi:hypothetical protein
VAKHLWLVGIKRGNAGVCEPCRRDDHAHCEPVPVAVDELGVGRSSTGYVECRCICMPEWMRAALNNGRRPPERAGEANRPRPRTQFYEGLMQLTPAGRGGDE